MNRVSDARDVAGEYRLVPEDFVKHLLLTLAIVAVVVLIASALFGLPEQPPLTIKGYATGHPVIFEQVALRALDGQGQLANYGPPYNQGTGSVQTGIQSAVGVLHPINAAQDFILKPLAMAASINPAIRPALKAFTNAPAAQQKRWEQAATTALGHAVYRHGTVVWPSGSYGPVRALMTAVLNLGRSGLMYGSLTRNPAVVDRLDNQNALLFLQGTPLQTLPATQSMQGAAWGIIHPAVNGYPGAWWMTIPTWIYQWPVVANSAAPDALALVIGFLFWAFLAATPWIPGWRRIPQYVGVHRLIWQDYYHDHPASPTGALRREEIHNA